MALNAPQSPLLDELSCQQLVTRYFRALDAGDANDVAALFSDTGVWRRQGADITGQAAVRAAVRERQPNVVIRHHVSNIDVRMQDAEHAFGISYYVLYRYETGQDEKPPFDIAGPVRAGENIHRFIKKDGVWKLSFTQAKPLFRLSWES